MVIVGIALASSQFDLADGKFRSNNKYQFQYFLVCLAIGFEYLSGFLGYL